MQTLHLEFFFTSNKTKAKTVSLTFSLWAVSGFDLILISLLSVEVQRLYFPTDDPKISILVVYGTLSLSLLGRVFGGLFFGRLADIYGRKRIVTLCLLLLSITMIISAYMPSVYSMGKDFMPNLPSTTLPILFILTRILIGFFVGGIWPTAAILGMENSYQSKEESKTLSAITLLVQLFR